MAKKISELEKVEEICLDEEEKSKEEFNPSYEVVGDYFGPNSYSNDCCRCNPQRC